MVKVPFHQQVHGLIILLLGGVLAGCGVSIDPVPKAPQVVAAPDHIRLKKDRVTNQPVLNLLTLAEMDERAERNLQNALQDYEMLGFQHITADRDPRLMRLERVFIAVHQHSHLKASPLRIVLIDNPVFQAYTFGGGAVVFYTGLTERLNDDELAAVIGHEIAHIAASHIAEQTSRSLVNIESGYWEPSLTGLDALNAEMEADQIGLVYATLAGFSPIASVQFWAKQARQQGQDILNPFADSHPTYQDRAKYLQESADKLQQLPRHLSDHDRHHLIFCNPIYCNQ